MARARKSNKGNSRVDSTVIDGSEIVKPEIEVPQAFKSVDPNAEFKAKRYYAANTFNLTPWEKLTPECRNKLIKSFSKS